MNSALPLLLVAILLSTSGELMLKQGMNYVGELSISLETLLPTLIRVFTQPLVLLGFIFIFGGSLFWLVVISRVDLSLAYPLLALGYIWVAFLSWMLLGENLSLSRLAGIVVIVVGVILLTHSAGQS